MSFTSPGARPGHWGTLLACAAVLLSACAERAPAPQANPAGPHAAFEQFEDWTKRYQLADASARPQLEPEGLAVAQARRDALLTLLQSDPRAAVAERLPFHLYRDLPAKVRAVIERPVDTVARFDVLVAENRDGSETVERYVEIDGRRYRAYVFGHRLDVTTKTALPVHGIVLDGVIALTDSPVRKLEFGEAPAPGRPITGPEHCPEPRLERLLDLGDEVRRVCSDEEADQVSDELVAAELRIGPDDPTEASSWTFGHKRVLVIRVDFDDMPGDPLSEAQAKSMIDDLVNGFYQASSYGKTSLSGTVTPVLRMPQPSSFYAPSNSDALLQDARTAASNAGFPENQYELDVVAFRPLGFSWAGLGRLGGRGAWLNGSFGSTAIHELGHNYGLSHARRRDAFDDSVIGPANIVEYGNPFDVMGGGGTQGHFNAPNKNRLDWIPGTELGKALPQPTTFRIYDLEKSIGQGLHAVRIPKDAQRDYWLEFRPSASEESLRNGVLVHFGYQSGTELLDLTPATPSTTFAGRQDSPLAIGRTWSDPYGDIHITAVGPGGTTPESLDVVVAVGPNRGAPPTVSVAASDTSPAVGAMVTFTATATDPDGDTLAYFWDFDDGNTGPNAATVTKSFGTPGEFSVRCTVSDMKGGVATASILVTVGDGGTRARLSGTVLENGQPLEGVRITDGSRSTWTDSNGHFDLTRVQPGGVVLTAIKTNYTFSPVGFSNPLSVGINDVGGLDFAATRNAFIVRGKVTSLGNPVAGVTVRAGSIETVSQASGEFALGPLPPGTHTLQALNLGQRKFIPDGFNNPVTVSGDLSGINFVEEVFTVTGTITGINAPVTVTNGFTSTVSYQGTGGQWLYTLDLTGGSWNIWAEAPGYILTPSFLNPVEVGQDMTGLDFTAAPGTAYTLRGKITLFGEPVEGVQVTGAPTNGRTDSQGWFVITGVPEGVYTLVPRRTPLRFQPESRSAVVAGSNLNGLHFTALPRNEAPYVVKPATPAQNPVTRDTVELSVQAEDDMGPTNLTFTWEAVGRDDVGFQSNGTSLGDDTVAKFFRPGDYTLRVVVEDAEGLTATSETQVTVVSTLTTLGISPEDVGIAVGQSVTFSLSALDQFGALLGAAPAVEWSASGGGEISQTGTFVAKSPGTWTVQAKAAGDLVASATVRVVSPPVIASVTASPDARAKQPVTLQVVASDDEGPSGLVYTWSVFSGPGPATFTPNGTVDAATTQAVFDEPGDYMVSVIVRDVKGHETQGMVEVKVAPAGGAGCGCSPTSGGPGVVAFVTLALLGTRWRGSRRASASD